MLYMSFLLCTKCDDMHEETATPNTMRLEQEVPAVLGETLISLAERVAAKTWLSWELALLTELNLFMIAIS